ncbi:UBX domain-containing protein 1 [Paragonimus heterotremus]|uniref:UBX domain-containing protein 1 n=1 Tax=Paragonimus heterotremus TaxID=100268 RepID=A0A8J4X342_9TREM|nr:UBX domain-containing protein 1 [Paragonimus heterotremus]
MDEHSELVKKVCTVTHISEAEAKHLLEAYQWSFDEAIRAHFDVQNDASPPPATINFGTSTSNFTPPPKQKIITFDAIRTPSNDDPDQGQAFYVGGSETGGGGQQVLGPPKKNRNMPDPTSSPDQFVHALFSAAKGQGAEVLDMDRYNEKTNKSKTRTAFSGTGFKLGEDPNEPSVPEPRQNASGSTAEGNADSVMEKSVVVKMWRDGFSLDNGPLRAYNDPSSFVFLEDIKAGRVPQELILSASGGLVNVLLEDHHHEEWRAPPVPKVIPFSGKGTMLGHPVPRITTNSPSTTANEPTPLLPGPEVDDSKPVTQLQVRLPDGGRLLVRLNHSHTILDIRQAIVSQRPSLAACPFTLLTTFPNRELTEDNQTIQDAKLLNCALLIRLT